MERSFPNGDENLRRWALSAVSEKGERHGERAGTRQGMEGGEESRRQQVREGEEVDGEPARTDRAPESAESKAGGNQPLPTSPAPAGARGGSKARAGRLPSRLAPLLKIGRAHV